MLEKLSEELTKAQKRAVKLADELLAKAGLTSYTTLEHNTYIALTTAHESVEMGKQLYAMVNRADGKVAAIRELIKDEPCGCVAPNTCSTCDMVKLRTAITIVLDHV